MSKLQIQTTQNPHTQATTKPSTIFRGFGDIKAHKEPNKLKSVHSKFYDLY